MGSGNSVLLDLRWDQIRSFMLDASVTIDDATIPTGSMLIDMDTVNRSEVAAALESSSLEIVMTDEQPDVAMHLLDLPRVGLYQSWTSTQNAGWVRYSLDEAGIPYTLFSKDRARRGNLLEEFDVILVPHMGGGTSLSTIVGGIDPKWSPLPYSNSPQSPNHGHILSSEDITGGLGFPGMAAFESFIREGGTLIALGSAGVMVTDSGILRGINRRNTSSLNTPGSIMTTKITDPSSPLVYGYEEITHVMRGNMPIYSVPDYDREYAPMQFGTKHWDEDESEEQTASDETADLRENEDAEEPAANPPLILSGGIVRGADVIDSEPALVSKSLDDGHIVLFSWNPMHRHVNLHDHAFVYNAILSWNDL